MKKVFVYGVVAALSATPLSAFAADTTSNGVATSNGLPAQSERAMSPDSSKAGATPDKTMTGRSSATSSERAMDATAGQPGASANPKSERAMDPAKSEK